MEFRHIAHATVLITASNGQSLLIDPYAAGGLGGAFSLAAIEVESDFVVASHGHADHNAVDGLPGNPEVITSGQFGPFLVRRHAVFHDEYEGTRFGGSCDVLEVEVDGKSLVHLSDAGAAPTQSSIGPVDVLFVPVGGFFTISALQALEWARFLGASEIVPIHFADDRINLPLHTKEFFERHHVSKF